MASNRENHLARDSAAEIADRRFKPFQPPAGLDWLEVLQRNGLVRFDPDPSFDFSDPLRSPRDVVRFSFQRFQDHLMADALLADVQDIKAALAEGGKLAFIRDEVAVSWEWQGLVEAISIQSPERFKIEFVDALPGKADTWWRQWHIRDAFIESVRWRERSAFTDRTLALLNSLSGTESKPLSLLVELSASVDHPWNAEFLHRNLARRKMPDRDKIWSLEIGDATDDDSHPIHRLIDWCLRADHTHGSRETLRLCALVLTWCFALSSRLIRDRATKALTSIFLARPDIFSDIVHAFAAIDDLYVWERIFGAAYGACCIDPSTTRVGDYSKLSAERVFSGYNPPESLLLRDYARGIVELAEYLGVLPDEIDLARCRPPYRSPSPKFNVSEAILKKVVSAAGDSEIARSCEVRDFGRYKIATSVDYFVAVKLSSAAPYSSQERYKRFEDEVVGTDQNRIAALARLRDTWMEHLPPILGVPSTDAEEPKNIDVGQWLSDMRVAEEALLAMLSPDERRRYRLEAKPTFSIASKRGSGQRKRIAIEAAKRWVAKQAYDFGWTKKRFPHELQRYYDYARQRPIVERIGKKYQWLALDKLLCRLADNYWLGGIHSYGTKKYDFPFDIGFHRDIDPTVLPRLDGFARSQPLGDKWVLGPTVATPDSSEDELSAWPFKVDPGKQLKDFVYRHDSEGRKWLTLYDHRSVTTRYERDKNMQHGLRQQEFRLVFCVLVRRADTERLVRHLRNEKIQVHHWEPPEFTDGPYLLEAPWRSTWSRVQWDDDGWATPKGLWTARPVCDYIWESHLDASLAKGARSFVPSPWWATQLGLWPDRFDPSTYRDALGRQLFIGSKLEPDGSSALVEANVFHAYLVEHQLDCIWLLIAERNAWPGGGNDNAAWRRSEGFCWTMGGKLKAETWNEDAANGESRKAIPR